MKTFLIEVEERDESILMEILRRFKIHIQLQTTAASLSTSTVATSYEPKTLGHFLSVSQSLTAWTDQEVQGISDIHEELNKHIPQSW